mgnify:CR=1 FL=1
MRFPIDNALSPLVAQVLREGGHDAVYVRDGGLQAASDAVIFDLARQEERIVVSADADFGFLLAQQGWRSPSVILFRGASPRRPPARGRFLLAELEFITADLAKGAIVVFQTTGIRVRALPLA